LGKENEKLKRERASAIALALLIIAGTSVGAFEIQRRISTAASDTIWYVGLGFQFSTIQQAINDPNVTNGDTIEVHWNYTYSPPYESVYVNKTLTIKPYSGDPRAPTVYSFSVEVPNVEIDGFIVQQQIYLNSSNDLVVNNTAGAVDIGLGSNNTLIGNSVSNFVIEGPFYVQNISESNMLKGKPIYYLVNQHDRIIPANAGYVAIVNSLNITAKDLLLGPNSQGVQIVNSTQVTVGNVSLLPGLYGYGIVAWNSSQINVRDFSNYGVYFGGVKDSNVQNAAFDLDAVGRALELDYSWNNTIRDITGVSSNDVNPWIMITMTGSYYNVIQNNVVMDHATKPQGVGMQLFNSSNNQIIANNISRTYFGLLLDNSNGSLIFHNNFLYNSPYQARTLTANNSFDNGLEGNYWSDYSGPDANGTGIIDTPYINVSLGVTDNHPLEKAWSEKGVYERPVSGATPPDKFIQKMYTFSNCTLGLPPSSSIAAGFTFNRSLPPTITLNATCGYSGFLQVIIPRNWTDGPFNVTVNGVPLDLSTYPPAVNSTFSSIYMLFDSSGTHTVKISGSELGSIPGDLNGDGVVNILDAIILGNNFGAQG
jgi:hypothetical protein